MDMVLLYRQLQDVDKGAKAGPRFGRNPSNHSEDKHIRNININNRPLVLCTLHSSLSTSISDHHRTTMFCVSLCVSAGF